MKIEDIKKKLIIEGVFMAIALSVLGATVYGLGILSDSYDSQSTALNGQVSSAAAQLATLRGKYSKIEKNSFLYDEVTQKNAGNMLAIDRDFMRKKLDDFKNRFNLSDVHLTLSTAQDIEDKKSKAKIYIINSSDAVLTFNALSDDDAYNFIQALQDELPGSVRITEFDIKREPAPVEVGLRAIIETGKFTFITGTVKFTWFGLRQMQSPATTLPGTSANRP